MRIASLVPHATELLFALGLGDQVVGVTHECDYPRAAAELPRLTRDALQEGLESSEIDAAVRERTLAGEAIYELDEETLASCEPDLIVTQALCPVCAVSYEEVASVADRLTSRPRVIALDPKTFGETIGDIRTVATATDRKDEGAALVKASADRVDAVRLAVRRAKRPRAVALEWLDPVFVAGHWTPQMIELAGGMDALGMPGEPSQELSWEAVQAANPDILILMPCGYHAARAVEEGIAYAERLRTVGAGRVVAVDASSYFSRPGPRLLDGLELLAHIFHPDSVPKAAGEAIELDLDATHIR